MAILKDTTYCSTCHPQAFLTSLFTVFALRIASAHIPVNPSTIAIDLVINIVDNSAIGSFSPDVEAMQQAIAKIGKEQYRNSGYVVWIYIDYNKCETKKCCPFFDLKHNIWKKQPSWKKVFSKDDSNISSPGGWSQEELTKSLVSRLTKQAVGSFWNDVKRK